MLLQICVLINTSKQKKTPFSLFVRKRINSLLVPYLFFELIGLIVQAIFKNQALLIGITNTLFVKCNVGADWFLVAMFMGDLIFYFTDKYLNRNMNLISIIVSIIFPMFMAGNQLFVIIGRALLAYSFTVIGHFGKKLLLHNSMNSISELLISSFIVCASAIINMKFGGNNFYACVVNNPATLVVGGIAGTIMTISFARLIRSSILSKIGEHTLTIMGTHQIVIYIMTATIPGMYKSIPKCILLLIAIILFEIPIVYFIDQYLPFCVGRKYLKK